jgi:hypothetical protein
MGNFSTNPSTHFSVGYVIFLVYFIFFYCESTIENERARDDFKLNCKLNESVRYEINIDG